MEKWLVGRRAATSGIYRVFDDENPIAVVHYLRDHTRFARPAQAYSALPSARSKTRGEMKRRG
jgi:hypothetical protein